MLFFLKEKIFDFSKLFDWVYLTESPAANLRCGAVYLAILAVFIIGGLVIQIISARKKYPKFYKKFLKRLGDFFIYLPTLSIFFILARLSGISGLNKRVYLVSVILIWLIWFCLMIYYRLAVVSKMWLQYKTYKEEERYYQNVKAKN